MKPSFTRPFQTAESDVPHARDTATFLKARLAFAEFARTSDGKLHLLVYGKVITGHVDPIEKKPVVHYMPGSKIFSIATTGCNWLCHYCQNFDISLRRKVEGSDHSPEDIAGMAVSHGCQGLAYTYNQPTIFVEFARDVGL